MNPNSPASPPSVDPQNPWLGLASFTEETRAFFHGRDEEIAELARRVQRKLLTVLFGQSGHGKTSVLRAGLVPRLRPEGFCPVYVRLDYSPGTPPPAEQIKQAVFRATAQSGTWSQTGAAVAGESLWEFLHHRDDVLRDAAGRTLTPLLIFDQFEEIFTLAQTDATGRARAQEFLAGLADLVENRPPAALEARIDHDEADAARFDFTRADYRILITLREDYLPHLESLKNAMPSVTQNRVRLARMTGAQAIEAVVKPGAGLVSLEVARAIVLFVSGATDIAHAEVEPPLLSLVCRELNEARLAQGHATISADLLAGSRDTILSEFYERALADQPAGVRRFIEDELLTDSGFRESIAEERVKKAFAAAGAPPGALATLVDCRLLRVEERLDVRRVELTHDVLCGIVAASRGARRERETQEASARQLAETQAKEAATRRALFRARLVAAVCAVLALGALAGAIFGFVNWLRADAAEKQALAAGAEAAKSRQLAENGRAEAEKLITFLDDDLWRQLAPFGQLKALRTLAQSVVDYYKQMPAALRTPDAERNRALALGGLGYVLTIENNTAEAAPLLQEAVGALDALRAAGDNSIETLSGLSRALVARAFLAINQAGTGRANQSDYQRAAELLRGPAGAPGASAKVLEDFSAALVAWGNWGANNDISVLLEADDFISGWLVREPTNLRAATLLGQAKTRLAPRVMRRGDVAKAVALDLAAIGLFDDVLASEPTNSSALNFRAIARGGLAASYVELGRLPEALAAVRQSAEDYERCGSFDPTNTVFWGNAALARRNVASELRRAGRIEESARELRTALALEPRAALGGWFALQLANDASQLSALEAERGRPAAAQDALRQFERLEAVAVRESAEESAARQFVPEILAGRERTIWLENGGHDAEVFAQASEALPRIASIDSADNPGFKNNWLDATRVQIVRTGARLGHFADAERAARELAESQPLRISGNATLAARSGVAWARAWQALALVRLGRQAEALVVAEPALADLRAVAAVQRESSPAKEDVAFALYVTALAQPPNATTTRRAQLDEAANLLAAMPVEYADLTHCRELAGWIAQERAK